MNTFTIYAPSIGHIGQYATTDEAQAAIRFLPYSVRHEATIERSC